MKFEEVLPDIISGKTVRKSSRTEWKDGSIAESHSWDLLEFKEKIKVLAFIKTGVATSDLGSLLFITEKELHRHSPVLHPFWIRAPWLDGEVGG